jgi:HAD superfamily hydrolase (TIGR01549 family)
MPNPRALILDLDNTAYAYDPCHEAGLDSAWLVGKTLHARLATKPQFVAAYKAARDQAKESAGHHAARHCRLLYFKNLVETTLGGTAFDPVNRLHQAYWKGYFDRLQPDPGCREVLSALREGGTRIAWVTNFTTERQMLKIRALGLEDSRDLLVSSEEAGAEKPSPAPFLLALKRLGVAPMEATVVGDDLEADIRPALALKMSAIWMNRDRAPAPKEARVHVSEWREIPFLFLDPKRAVGQ